jgi:chloride intracellular channel protein 2
MSGSDQEQTYSDKGSEHAEENHEESVPEVNNGKANSTGDDVDDDRPVVELFVKAAVDKMKNGSCPTCHRYFLIFYILRERGLVDLVVTTFIPENPPKEVLEFSNGKRFPLVKVHKGKDFHGQDMSGVECETIDEIEQLVERFECDDMLGRRDSKMEAKAELVFEDLYMKLNQFLKSTRDDPTQITKILERVDDHLQETETKFMTADRLARADCFLLPTLQHLRVAGKAYKNYEIPTEYAYLWQYLKLAYETDAFKESCPADREIITHYQEKASCPAKIPRKKAQLMAEDRTFSVPDTISHGNGDVE